MITFNREKLKVKKETTLNLLKNKTCNNCEYYQPNVLSNTNKIKILSEYCDKLKTSNLPTTRTCIEWVNVIDSTDSSG